LVGRVREPDLTSPSAEATGAVKASPTGPSAASREAVRLDCRRSSELAVSSVWHVVARRCPSTVPAVAVRVLGTGVLIRLATEDEVEALERARGGSDFLPDPSVSYKYAAPDRPLGEGEVYVVSQAFVDFVDGEAEQRWRSYEHHGESVSAVEDATLELLKLAESTIAEDLVEDLLSDMRIGGLGVSRWALLSAPRRIELTPELEARLAPLQRG
jgi:hypothetical protein